MGVKLYIKDLQYGTVHEYGTDSHDSLILRKDGAVEYYNLQTGDGSGEHGSYRFCKADGSDPRNVSNWQELPFLNIGGDREPELRTVIVRESVAELEKLLVEGPRAVVFNATKQRAAVKVAIAALRRFSPQTPLPEKAYGIGKCPKCGAVFLDKSTSHCGNCGQALDWGGDDNENA